MTSWIFDNATPNSLVAWAERNGLKPYVSHQILRWLFAQGIFEPDLFTDVSLKARTLLKNDFSWDLPQVHTALQSQDGSWKFLFKLHDGLYTETVLMFYEQRTTVCISSQVGCRMACSFCQTGKMGLIRNLTYGEIIGQVVSVNAFMAQKQLGRRVTNVVFMGMGEPLDNYENTFAAAKTLTDPLYFGLSKYRVTVSTSGLVPEIRRMATDTPVALAVSLHACDDVVRSRMMPINRQYNLAQLKEALGYYQQESGRLITFEYIMIHNENDSLKHAKDLVRYISGLNVKINLIPMNAHPGSPLQPSQQDSLRQFQTYLSQRGYPAPVRYSKAQDISGACGQLAAKRTDELHMDPRLVARQHRQERSLAAKAARHDRVQTAATPFDVGPCDQP